MPFNRSLRCKVCGNEWKQFVMTRDEPHDQCSFGCAEYAEEGLSAPGINRGSQDRGIQIPQSQGAREKLAADLALKGTGMTDINSHMKNGDIAAKPVATPQLDLPLSARQQAAQVLTPSFIDTKGMGYSQAASDPTKARNLGLLGGLSKSAPLNRLPRTRTRL